MMPEITHRKPGPAPSFQEPHFVSFQMERADYKRLAERARQEGISVAQLIRRMLSEHPLFLCLSVSEGNNPISTEER